MQSRMLYCLKELEYQPEVRTGELEAQRFKYGQRRCIV